MVRGNEKAVFDFNCDVFYDPEYNPKRVRINKILEEDEFNFHCPVGKRETKADLYSEIFEGMAGPFIIEYLHGNLHDTR